MRISTHTLTWSVTSTYQRAVLCNEISTHTLTWSVTCKGRYPQGISKNFNSHAHVERDFKSLGTHEFVSISTHTLTWSVTIPTVCKLRKLLISTHTLTWSVTE